MFGRASLWVNRSGQCRGWADGWLALLALLLGVISYAWGRPPASLPAIFLYWQHAVPWLDGLLPVSPVAASLNRLANHLPDLLHPLAFSALTIAVMPGPRRVALVCGGWGLADALLELAQHRAISTPLQASLSDWLGQMPVVDQINIYLVTGRFDSLDLFCTALGSVIAYVVVHRLIRHECAESASRYMDRRVFGINQD